MQTICWAPQTVKEAAQASTGMCLPPSFTKTHQCQEWVLLGIQSWESSLESRDLVPSFYEEVRKLHLLKHSQKIIHPK